MAYTKATPEDELDELELELLDELELEELELLEDELELLLDEEELELDEELELLDELELLELEDELELEELELLEELEPVSGSTTPPPQAAITDDNNETNETVRILRIDRLHFSFYEMQIYFFHFPTPIVCLSNLQFMNLAGSSCRPLPAGKLPLL